MTMFSAAMLNEIVSLRCNECNPHSPSTSSGDFIAISYRCSNCPFLSIRNSGGGVGCGEVERDSTFDEGVDVDWRWRRFVMRHYEAVNLGCSVYDVSVRSCDK